MNNLVKKCNKHPFIAIIIFLISFGIAYYCNHVEQVTPLTDTFACVFLLLAVFDAAIIVIDFLDNV